MKQRTVLVVDDEPLTRWSVSETLRDLGYRVTQAGDALSAMQAMVARGQAADIVLLDLHLPDARDLSVLSAMRSASPSTPIILMTAYGSDAVTVEACRRGAFATLNKPFDMSVLAPLVATAIDSRAPLY